MAKKQVDNQKIHLLILQESIWQIEDKIDRTLEQIGRQEAALLKIRSLAQEIEQKLGIKPARRRGRPSK